VTINRAGAVITYTFAGCTWPLGLVAVNGKITATMSTGAAPGSLDVAVKSDGLTLNKTPIDQSATAHVSYAGTTRTVRWDGQYHGQTPTGRNIQHDAGYTSSYDTASGCVTLSGTGQTTVDGRGVKTEVTDYLRCGDRFACPTSGEVITTGVVSGLSIKVDFLGGNKADVTGVKGRVYHVTLACKA
jgi:hypothetical protein